MPSISKGICEGPSILPTPLLGGFPFGCRGIWLSINRARRRFLAATPPPSIYLGGGGLWAISCQPAGGGCGLCASQFQSTTWAGCRGACFPISSLLDDVRARASQFQPTTWGGCRVVHSLNTPPLFWGGVQGAQRVSHPSCGLVRYWGCCRRA